MAFSRIETLGDARGLRLLLDSVIDYAIYMINTEGLVVSWNSGASRLKGYSAAEIIGQPYATFFTPEDRKRGLPEGALEIAAREGRYETEGWRVRKDGSRFFALAMLDAIRDETGVLIGFAKVTRDITEREQTRRRLLESERRFRRLVDAVVDYAIYQLDPDGIVATWNVGAQRIKGYAAGEIIGQHFSRFYTEEDRAAGVPQKALETAAREGRFESEGWRLRKDGTKFYALVVIDPIRREDGELLGFAKVTRDITERMENQRLLKETQEQLAASQKMEAIGQLSGGIAHDFNNLLMIVLGNLETADRIAKNGGEANPKIRRAIENAMRGAQRAAALTARLLAFSRRQPLAPKPLQPGKFLGGVTDFLQRSLGETIDIEANVAPGVWQIEADPNHLEAALLNLVINARDAMPSGGKVMIEATNVFVDDDYSSTDPELSAGEYVLISVTDGGAGMPPEILSRAFEPFFTTKELGQGTGLGLSQVYGFVKQSGGHIEIASKVDHGTTVRIYLPRYMKRAAEEDESPSDNALHEAPDGTILIVEDNNDLRCYLAEVLCDLGYRVQAAAHADEALSILKQNIAEIDLLLTDIVMPGMNGRDLGRHAQRLRPDLPVLYMTGYAHDWVLHYGRLDEDIELLQKPIAQAQLAARVRDILDQSARKA